MKVCTNYWYTYAISWNINIVCRLNKEKISQDIYISENNVNVLAINPLMNEERAIEEANTFAPIQTDFN